MPSLAFLHYSMCKEKERRAVLITVGRLCTQPIIEIADYNCEVNYFEGCFVKIFIFEMRSFECNSMQTCDFLLAFTVIEILNFAGDISMLLWSLVSSLMLNINKNILCMPKIYPVKSINQYSCKQNAMSDIIIVLIFYLRWWQHSCKHGWFGFWKSNR